jgi:Ca2+-binding RTX toxin-like protein
MALGFFMVPPGYAGPVPPGYTLLVYTNTQTTYTGNDDDIAIGSDIGANLSPEGGYDILDYSGFGRGIRIDEFEGTVRDANGIIARSNSNPGRGFEEYRGTAFNDVLAAGAGDDQVLRGEGGDDTLVGGINVELLDGGAGIDTASYANSTVGVTVDLRLAGAQVSAGDANGDTLTGIENLTGSAHNDSLHGNAGDNVLIGGAGADVLVGGAGIDTADYSGSPAGVTVDLVLGTGHGGDAEGDLYLSIENITGSAFADKLTGDAGANVLLGGAGDDVLHGGAGADTLDGGDGSDYVLLNIENLYGSSFNDHLTGDNGANIIGGELGDDTLVGNGGNDTLSGEGGNDNLDGGDGNDRLVGGDGIDTIHGGNDNDSIDAGTGNDVVFGDAGNDTIVGGTGDDQLSGGDGNDLLIGGAGADALDGGAGNDTATYAGSTAGVTVSLATGLGTGGDAEGDTLNGIENIYGSDHNDVLTGNAVANTLSGGAGDDVLTGGLGADLLKGNAGNDTFVYTSIADSTVAPVGKDVIADFTTGDKIDLSAIDADGNSANGDTAFSFGTGGFTGHAGELRIVDFHNGLQGVYLDTNGDKTPDAIINVISDHALTAADFML